MNESNYDFFKGKEVKVILSFENGKCITYRGNIVGNDPFSILLNDRMLGTILISKKDISQVLEVL